MRSRRSAAGLFRDLAWFFAAVSVMILVGLGALGAVVAIVGRSDEVEIEPRDRELIDGAESCDQLYEMRSGIEVNADSVEEAAVALTYLDRRAIRMGCPGRVLQDLIDGAVSCDQFDDVRPIIASNTDSDEQAAVARRYLDKRAVQMGCPAYLPDEIVASSGPPAVGWRTLGLRTAGSDRAKPAASP